MDDTALVDRAREAIEASYAPYSKYRVGAALLTADGTVYSGTNVENANYSNSVHAEELALAKAVEDGKREFEAVAVSSNRRDGVTPCGTCRQSLVEFDSGTLRVLCDGDDGIERYTLGELLPESFSGRHLE